MEKLRSEVLIVGAVLVFYFGVMVPEVEATRYIVGGNMGWTSGVNYTIWAKGFHFYNGDWLFFLYDRNQMDVLEVSKTNYETCNSEHPLHNWTIGAGRDVVPLNVTRNYYFISGKGFCYRGMKLAVHVENPPPPPKAAPAKSGSPSPTQRGQNVISAPAPAPGPDAEMLQAPAPAPAKSSTHRGHNVSPTPDVEMLRAPALPPAKSGSPSPALRPKTSLIQFSIVLACLGPLGMSWLLSRFE